MPPTERPDTKKHMPQIFPYTDRTNDTELYFWLIEESAEELASLASEDGSLLAEARERFKADKRQREWLAVRSLLQNTPCKGEKILYHSNGKPYLQCEGKHISISHTGNIVAIAIADKETGIDIETKGRNALAVAAAYLQPQEIEALNGYIDKNVEALRLWTAKEAAFKLAPEKSTVLKDIAVNPVNERGNGTYSIIYSDGTTAICHIMESRELIISACTHG